MSQVSEVAEAAVDAVRRLPGVDLVDARASDDERDVTSLGDGVGGAPRRDRSAGVGVRVLRRGVWGFAAMPGLSEAVAVAAATAAVTAAENAAAENDAAAGEPKVRLAAEEPAFGHHATPIEIDPFAVAPETRLADLETAVCAARDEAGDLAVRASMRWWRSTTAYASSEGSRVEQVLVRGGATFEIDPGEGVRALRGGGLESGGYEVIAGLALAEEARRLGAEARALRSSPPCPAGVTTLVVDAPTVARALCDPRLTGDETGPLGRFVFGSPRVNVVADARLPGGAGSFGWDAEGVPARRTPLVSRGIRVGVLASRQVAAALGLGRSAGCARAASWSMAPAPRPSNLVLEADPAGPASLAELVADTERGVLVTGGAAWQIDGGKLGQIYRDAIFRGDAPGFWRGCDAIGAADSWRLLGLSFGEPALTVGVGAAPARFVGVEIGSRAG